MSFAPQWNASILPPLPGSALLSPLPIYPFPKRQTTSGARAKVHRTTWPQPTLACLIRGQKRPPECRCSLASAPESPCAGALGRLAVLVPTVGLLCSSAQARPSCPRPQGCANSSAGQRLCISKQLLKGHFRCGAATAIGASVKSRWLPQGRLRDWIKACDDKQAVSFIYLFSDGLSSLKLIVVFLQGCFDCLMGPGKGPL